MRFRAPQTLLIILAALSCSAVGQSPSAAQSAADSVAVSAEVLTPVVEVQPRQTLNLQLRLSNTSAAWQTVTPKLTVPAGWSVLLPAEKITLEPGAARLVLLTVLVGANAKAGSYTFPLHYFTSTDSPIQEVLFTVNVAAVDKIELQLLLAPDFVSGSEYQASFLLRNLGNTEHEFTFTAGSKLTGLRHTVSPAAAVLSPGSSVEITVSVDNPRQLTAQQTNIITVVARTRGSPALEARARSNTVLVPSSLSAAAALHTLPLKVRTSYQLNTAPTADPGSGAALEINGSGPLSESDSGRFRVNLRIDRFDTVDKLLIEYQHPNFEVQVGKLSFTPSPLTSSESGFGVIFRHRSRILGGKPTSAEIHAYTVNGKVAAGASLTAVLSEPATAANGTSATAGITVHASSEGVLGSVAASYKPALLRPTAIQLTNLDATYGVRLTTAGTLGNSLRGSLQLNEGVSFIKFSWETASAAFRLKDEHLTTVGFNSSLRISEALYLPVEVPAYLYLHYSNSWRWADDRAYLVIPPADADGRTETYGVGFYLGLGAFSLNTAYSRTATTAAPSLSQVQELTGLVQFRSDDIVISQSLEWTGKTGESTPASSGLEHQTTVMLTTGGSGRFSARFSGKYDVAEQEHGELSFGAAWSGTPLANLRLSGDVNLYLLHPTRLWDARLDSSYSFGNDHVLDFQLTTKPRRDQPFSVDFEIGYSIPIDVPLGRKAGIGSLAGTVRAGNGDPLAGLVVAVAGQAVTTDATGAFRFPALPVGEHLVHLATFDRLASNEIITPAAPHQVEIVEGRSARADFEIVTGSTVQGVLQVLSPQDTTDTVDDLPVSDELAAGIRIEVSNGITTLRTITDAHGRFRFHRVSAGSWSVRIADPGLPANYSFEPAEQQLQLEPGDVADVSFQLSPRVRRIRFDDGGVLTPPTLP